MVEGAGTLEGWTTYSRITAFKAAKEASVAAQLHVTRWFCCPHGTWIRGRYGGLDRFTLPGGRGLLLSLHTIMERLREEPERSTEQPHF